jgi:hypothetical protein
MIATSQTSFGGERESSKKFDLDEGSLFGGSFFYVPDTTE